MDEAYGAHELRFDEAADDKCRFLINGQHRYFTARDLDLTHIPVQPHRV